MLLDDLTAPAPAWSEAHHKRLDALFGYRVADLPWNRPTRFSRAVLGDFDAIGAAEVAEIPADERHAWAMARLIEAIGAEIARLADHRAAIDPARIAEDRADAVALGRLDPGKEGALAQRYIAAAARDLSRALRDLHLVESRYGTDPDADPTPPSEPPDSPPRPIRRPKDRPIPLPKNRLRRRWLRLAGRARSPRSRPPSSSRRPRRTPFGPSTRPRPSSSTPRSGNDPGRDDRVGLGHRGFRPPGFRATPCLPARRDVTGASPLGLVRGLANHRRRKGGRDEAPGGGIGDEARVGV